MSKFFMPNRLNQPGANSLFCLFILLSIWASIEIVNAQSPQSPEKKKQEHLQRISGHVILISISGLGADLFSKPEEHRLRIPTIQSLRTHGTYAVGIESTFPSQTNPAHASLVTGTLPTDHGVVSDYPFNLQTATQALEPFRSVKEIKTETIWEYARRASVTTAAVGFPLTLDANIKYNLHNPAPGESQADAQLRNEVVEALNRKTDEQSTNIKPGSASPSMDTFNAEAASYLIEKYHPNLTMVNFTSFESVAQRKGLLSQEAISALERIDGFVNSIVDSVGRAGLMPQVTFILVSDHGEAKIEREFRPNAVLAKKGWLTTNAKDEVVTWKAVAQTYGGSAAIFVKNPQDEVFARQLEEVFIDLHKKPDSAIWRVLPRREAARLGADPRAALYLDAAPSYSMSPLATGSIISKTENRAAHGYSPSRSEMRAVLLFSGRGIKAGKRIEFARMIDIAPTIAQLLGLEMKTARGRVLSEALAQ
jgi:predicted AlkP superfamily pyrophosphatase or phosphodiesterase